MKSQLKGDTVYYSFQEFAEAYNGRPVVLHTTNQEKLQSLQNKVKGKCPVCGEPLNYHGGNVLTCDNAQCKGIATTITDNETGNDKVVYKPVFKLLSDGDFARRIFN